MKLSVVIVTPDTFATLRRTVRHLATQSIVHDMELIIVAPEGTTLGYAPEEVMGFGQVKVERLSGLWRVARARALGAISASAPYIAYTEDHCYPTVGWAEALVEAHEKGAVAVGPLMLNGNPNTGLSWANFFLNFGIWHNPALAGEAQSLAWHNTSYRREALLDYGDRLSRMLEVEGVLQDELRSKNKQFELPTRARVRHLNISLWKSHIYEQFHSGRLFGAMRSQGWSHVKRLLYIGGSPLIPWLRLVRTTVNMRRCIEALKHEPPDPGQASMHPRLLQRALPGIIVGVMLHTAGEVAGYATGVGSASERKSGLESHRYRHLIAAERLAEAPLTQP